MCATNQPLFSANEDATQDVSAISNITAVPETNATSTQQTVKKGNTGVSAKGYSSAILGLAVVAGGAFLL